MVLITHCLLSSQLDGKIQGRNQLFDSLIDLVGLGPWLCAFKKGTHNPQPPWRKLAQTAHFLIPALLLCVFALVGSLTLGHNQMDILAAFAVFGPQAAPSQPIALTPNSYPQSQSATWPPCQPCPRGARAADVCIGILGTFCHSTVPWQGDRSFM